MLTAGVWVAQWVSKGCDVRGKFPPWVLGGGIPEEVVILRVALITGAAYLGAAHITERCGYRHLVKFLRPAAGVLFYGLSCAPPRLTSTSGAFSDDEGGALWFAGDAIATIRMLTDPRSTQILCKKLQNKPHGLSVSVPFKPAAVIISPTPEDVEHIWGSHFGNFQKQVPFANFKTLLGDGIFAVDDDKWYKQRKAASHLFSSNLVKNHMGAVINERSAELERRLEEILEEKSPQGIEVAIADIFYALTMDVFADIAFGYDTKGIASYPKVVPLAEAFDRAQARIILRNQNPLWRLQSMLGMYPEDTVKGDVATVVRAVQNVTNARRGAEASAEKADLLDAFQRAAKKNKTILDPKMERDLAINFLLAGRDTTAGALTWMFLLVAKHPDVLRRMLEEVDAIDFDDSGNFPISRLGELEYVKAVCSETLRLYPSVVSNLVGVKEDDVLPCGITVKAGSMLMMSFFAMGRNPDVWGPDCEEFKPERFYKQPEPSPYKFATFKAGPRICLGKRLAYQEMMVVTHRLLRKFSFHFDGKVEDVGSPAALTMKPIPEHTMMKLTYRRP